MNERAAVSPYMAGLKGRCPRCGEGALFDGFLALKPACPHCGLDYAKADSGDGPAFFVMSIVSFVGVAIAVVARFVWQTPTWAAFAISAVASIALVLALLRPMKATLIALQFHNNAEEGRLEQ